MDISRGNALSLLYKDKTEEDNFNLNFDRFGDELTPCVTPARIFLEGDEDSPQYEFLKDMPRHEYDNTISTDKKEEAENDK